MPIGGGLLVPYTDIVDFWLQFKLQFFDDVISIGIGISRGVAIAYSIIFGLANCALWRILKLID